MKKILGSLFLAYIGFCVNVANAGSSVGTTQATATVASSCTITATDLNFGTIQAQTGYTTATNTLVTRCSNKLSYIIYLSQGTNVSGGKRYIKGAKYGGLINYGVCQTNTPVYACSGGTPWTDTQGVSSTGTASSQTFNMYAYVVNGYDYTPDDYTDTESVIIDF